MRRFVTIFLAGVVVILLIVGVVNYVRSRQQLTVSFDVSTSEQFTAVIYEVTDVENTDYQSYVRDENAVLTITGNTHTKIKKGKYVLAGQGNEGYANALTPFTLAEEPVTLTIKPAYSEGKLQNILNDQRGAIRDALIRSSPRALGLYDIDAEKLYSQGEWYGATLVPKNTDDNALAFDLLRLVMQKDGDTWKLATSPPELILSRVVYPDIPRDILVDINKL